MERETLPVVFVRDGAAWGRGNLKAALDIYASFSLDKNVGS